MKKINTLKMKPGEARRVIPRKVYKYFAVNDYNLDVISKAELWFSSPARFNDPFDCKINVVFGESPLETLERLRRFFPSDNPALRQMIATIGQKPEIASEVFSAIMKREQFQKLCITFLQSFCFLTSPCRRAVAQLRQAFATVSQNKNSSNKTTRHFFNCSNA